MKGPVDLLVTQKMLDDIQFLIKKGDYDSAEKELDRLFEIADDLSSEQRTSLFVKKAVVASSNEEEEIRLIEEFRKKDLHNINLLSALESRYLFFGKYQEAIKCMKELISLADDEILRGTMVNRFAKTIIPVLQELPEQQRNLAKSLIMRLIKKSKSEYLMEKILELSSRQSSLNLEEMRSAAEKRLQKLRTKVQEVVLSPQCQLVRRASKLKLKNVKQAIRYLKEALAIGCNIEAIELLISIARTNQEMKQKIVSYLIPFIRQIKEVKHIVKIMEGAYGLSNKSFNKVIRERIRCLTSSPEAKAELKRQLKPREKKKYIAKYLQRKTDFKNIGPERNIENKREILDRIKRAAARNAEIYLIIGQRYLVGSKQDLEIVDYCLRQYAEKIRKKSNKYFELMLQFLQLVEDYELAKEVYLEARKRNVNAEILSRYSVFIQNIAVKSGINPNRIWESFGALEPVDIEAAKITGLTYRPKKLGWVKEYKPKKTKGYKKPY